MWDVDIVSYIQPKDMIKKLVQKIKMPMVLERYIFICSWTKVIEQLRGYSKIS